MKTNLGRRLNQMRDCSFTQTDQYKFLVANKRFYIRVCPSVGSSVRPSVSRFFNHGIHDQKWSNFHQCSCPTFATDAAVYTALFLTFLVACTRLYKSHCQSVGPIHTLTYSPKGYWTCVTAPAQCPHPTDVSTALFHTNKTQLLLLQIKIPH